MKLEGSTTNFDYMVEQLKAIAEGKTLVQPTDPLKVAPTHDELAKMSAIRLQALNMLMTLWATKSEL